MTRVIAISGAVCLLLTACDSKPSANRSASSRAQRGQAATNTPPDPEIQREIDQVSGVPIEADASSRPLVISEKAPSRYEWGVRTLEEGYFATGHTSSNWNKFAQAAFAAYTRHRLLSTEPVHAEMMSAVSNALQAGCDDPMILYIQSRYPADDSSEAQKRNTLASLRAHEGMLKSAYHPLYRFLAGLRACSLARTADRSGNRTARLRFTFAALEDLARDSNAPPAEVFDSATLLLDYSSSKGWHDNVTRYVDSHLKQNWGTHERWFRWRGLVEIEQAWDARGGGWANTVTDTGWEGFAEHLDQAAGFLKKAWSMNTNSSDTCILMMRLGLGRGDERPIVEKWFQRAMALDPNNYEAAKMMTWYLEPRWYGSEADTLAFARKLVESTNYGGFVPLVLVDRHKSLAKYSDLEDSPDYWRRPQVWADVHAAYEKFFRLNTNAVGWRHNYALDAYQCGKYDVFLEQAKLFSAGTNYAWFGGTQKWTEMLAKASRAHPARR